MRDGVLPMKLEEVPVIREADFYRYPGEGCQQLLKRDGSYHFCLAPGRFVDKGPLTPINTNLCDDHLIESAVGHEWLRINF